MKQTIVAGMMCLLMAMTGVARAATYYWDDNSSGANFGAAGASTGTWAAPTAGPTAGWSLSITGADAFSAFTTSTSDPLNFGNGATGLGAGTITVSGTVDAGNITFASGSGAIVLSGGTINLAAAETITVNNASNTISSSLTGAPTSLTKTGGGILILSGTNTYSGTTTINRGTLTLNRQTGTLTATSPLTFSGAGTFNMDNAGASGDLTQTLGALTFSAGEGLVQTTRTADFDQAITFNSLSARTAGASGNFVNTGTNSATNGFIIATGAPTAGTLINRGIFYNGSSYAAYDSGGFVRGYGTGDTNFVSVAGAATMGTRATTDNVLLTGSITAQTATAVNTINMGAQSITMTGASPVLQANGLLSSGSATATLGGGTTPRLQPTTANGEMVIRVNGSSDILTISSVIQNNTGASSLTKSGAGTLTLKPSAVNTYTGGTFVNGGSLVLDSASRTVAPVNPATILPASTDLTIGAGATVRLLGTQPNNIFNTTAGTITINPGGTLAMEQLGTTVNSGNLFNLTLNGGTISNANASGLWYTRGTITVTENSTIPITLAPYPASGANYLLPVDVASGKTLTQSGPVVNNAVGGGISGLIKNNTGTLTLTGVNTYTSTTAVTAGTLQISSAGSLGSGTYANTIAISTGALFQYSSSAAQTLSGAISGLGALTKDTSSTSTLTLSSATNSYTGATTVNAGTLAIASTGILANTAIAVNNAGSTFLVRPGSGAVNLGNTATAAAGVTLSLGSGTNFSMVDAAVGTANLAQGSAFTGAALTLNAATLNFELSGATADKLAITGVASTVSVTGVNTINLTPLAALTAGTYNLITTANATGGLNTGGTFAFGNGQTAAVVSFGGVIYPVTLNTFANVISVTVGASVSAMTWTGQTAGNGATDVSWNTTGSTNWAADTLPVAYTNGNPVTFQDTNTVTTGNVAASSLALTIQAGGVTPGSTTFTNSTLNYTVGGGAISGTGGLTMSGSGTTTLTGANTYTGATTVSTGTLQYNGSLTGAGTAIGVSGGTLGVGTSASIARDLNLSSGAVTLAGTVAGTLTVTGGTLTTSAGSPTVTIADFSAGTGTVTASTTPLAITNTLRLPAATTARLTGGTSFTAQGANLTNTSNASTLTLSGGTLTFSFAAGAPVSSGITATASSNFTNRAPIRTVDNSGMTGTFPNGTAGSAPDNNMWLSNNTTGTGTFISWDLGTSYTLSKIRIWNYNENTVGNIGRGIKTLTLETSTNGTTWTAAIAGTVDWTNIGVNGSITGTVLGTGAAGYGGFDWTLPSPLTTRYIRFNNAQNFATADSYTGLSEVAFFTANLTPVNLPITSVAATASSVLDLATSSGAHNLAALNLTAGGTTTALSLKNGASLTLNGDDSNNVISATGSSNQTASILPDATNPPSLIFAAARNVSVDTGVSLTIQSVISGGELTKIGGGTLTLSGANIYSGATSVSTGTLVVNGSILGASTSVTGVLRGSGDGITTGILGNAVTVNSGGVIWPGSSLSGSAVTTGELLTVNSLIMSAGSKMKIAFNSATNIQQVKVNGTVSLSGILSLGIPPSLTGGPYTILTSTDAISGNFTSVLVNGVDNTIGTNGTVSVNTVGNTIQVSMLASVTPVKIADFAAQSEGPGVNVSWTCVSEYQNAGFNIYRRAIQEPRTSVSGWAKVNPALIAGRITNPDERKYTYFDWVSSGGAGMYEYKLESIDVSGGREFYVKLSGVVDVDWMHADCDVSVGVIDSAIRSIDMEVSVQAAQRVEAVSAAVRIADANTAQGVGQKTNISAKVAEHKLGANASDEISVANDSVVGLRAANFPTHMIGVRWFSSGRIGTSSSYTTAKITYKNAGVMLIPQSAMPAGFDLKRVAIQREGRNLNVLAATNSGLLVYAPGYKDDYTNKDAIFIRNSSANTLVGQTATASGLFTSPMPVNVTSPASYKAEYRDVYFDYTASFRPYTFAPWFSSKYLTQGTAQDFSINPPRASGGPARLTVNLWSLTTNESVNPDHSLQVMVNNQWVGESSWSGGGRMLTLSFDVKSGVLNAGDNTISLVTPVIAGVETQIALLHSITTDYTSLLDGSKPFEIVNDGASPRLFEMNNVPASGVWVVDTRFGDRAALVATESIAQTDGRLRVRFLAASGGSGKYIVTPVGQENSPLNVSMRQVKALKLNGTYLATGPAQFSAGTQPLLLRRAKEGIRGAFVDQEQLFDYYNYGRYGPDGIRNAVRSVKPKYLLMVGRTTYDYLNYEGQNIDPLCPAYLVGTSFWAQTTSDSLFGDLGRGFPEVAVGRLPVNSTTELAGAIGHIVSYKGIPSSGIRLHAAADKTDAKVANFGEQLDMMIKANNPDVTWQENYLETTYQSPQEVTVAMTAAANGGADLILYSGHGSAARVGSSDPSILDQSSVQQWTGNTVFLQSTCTANWMAKNVDDYKSIAIQALTQAQGGISASIGTSTYMNSDVATAFMNQVLKNMNQGKARWGNVLLSSQQWAGRQRANGFYTDLMNTEQLFGDPAMPVFAPKGGNAINQSSSAVGTF